MVAVSKAFPAEHIRQIYDLGQYHFGENYLQEAIAKIERLHALDITWHFLGSIQRNKTTLIARHFSWVHTLSREVIAERLNDSRGRCAPQAPLNVCIQVNIDDEGSKDGVAPEDAAPLLAAVARLPYLRLRGLMIIPRAGNTGAFQDLARLRQTLETADTPIDTLSMGMSDDFAEAIAAGATMIRVGSAIFGERKAKADAQ